MPRLDIDWNEVRDNLTSFLLTEFKDLVSGLEADLQAYGRTIAGYLTEAVKTEDEALLSSAKGQAKLLAQIHAIRVEKAAWTAVDTVLDIAFKVLLAFVASI